MIGTLGNWETNMEQFPFYLYKSRIILIEKGKRAGFDVDIQNADVQDSAKVSNDYVFAGI
ncbi:MAG TPA: hypothetical protein DIT95_16925 [Arenibacter sp.]|nr:hypothetical protein [Arenibacter sp.]